MSKPFPSSRNSNITASLVAAMAVGFLYINTNPTTAGANPEDLKNDGDEFVLSSAPKITIATAASPEDQECKDCEAEEKAHHATGPKPDVTGRLALLMNILMAEKAEAYINGLETYKVSFHKQERISGELQDPQTIEMKVSHKPFTVYMKWVNGGDRGRQILYTPAENEGQMLVKAGGLAGRLLPPIKVDPQGSLAMAESRYPVSMAGMLPMIRDIIKYRKQDLEVEGVGCEMFDNQKLNDINCYCFVITYPDQEMSKIYRKSMIYLAKTNMLPVQLINYTWAKDAEKSTPEELDQQTLVENYGFSNLKARADFAMHQKTFKRRRKKL